MVSFETVHMLVFFVYVVMFKLPSHFIALHSFGTMNFEHKVSDGSMWDVTDSRLTYSYPSQYVSLCLNVSPLLSLLLKLLILVKSCA